MNTILGEYESTFKESTVEYASSGPCFDSTVNAMVFSLLRSHGITPEKSFIERFNLIENEAQIAAIQSRFPTITLKTIEMYIESGIDDEEKGANGIVFTPRYIIDYILDNVGINSSGSSIIDPSCGCGSFLVGAADYMVERYNLTYSEVISNNLFGIDIVPQFIDASKLILSLLCLLHGENPKNLKYNLICTNSLDTDWASQFNRSGFDFVIGNPPYSNPHDLEESMAKLMKSFKTTKKGTSNIFYAFLEKGVEHLSSEGSLGFIIPNNYLSITAAQPLRKWLREESLVSKIVDFDDNMVFDPVRTYNSLLFLNRIKKDSFKYAVIEKTENIETSLKEAEFIQFNYSDLEDEGWKLLPSDKLDSIHNIERFESTIKQFIHTGIATLRDDVYIVDGFDENMGMFYKDHNGNRYHIEPGIVRKLYKISKIVDEKSISDATMNIICPYETMYQVSLDGKKKRISKLISEQKLIDRYPKCYEYLLEVRDILNERDNGRGASPKWYAYGRTQGLNYIGRKLLFPTFSAKPKFMILEDEEALFCNGYAIVEDDNLPLEIIQPVINSQIMDFYVSNTSYPIEGGYYCYQKKFIQKFSIPSFDENEKAILLSNNEIEINQMLSQKYNVPF